METGGQGRAREGGKSIGLKGRWEGAAKATDSWRTVFSVNNAVWQSEEQTQRFRQRASATLQERGHLFTQQTADVYAVG